MSFDLSSHLVQGSVWYDGPSMRKINSLWPSDALGGIIELGAWPIVWGVGGIGVGWWKVGGSPSYFRGQRRICLISLKFHNTFLGVGGTHLHLLGVGDTRIHRWGGKHSPPMYFIIWCHILIYMVFNIALVSLYYSAARTPSGRNSAQMKSRKQVCQMKIFCVNRWFFKCVVIVVYQIGTFSYIFLIYMFQWYMSVINVCVCLGHFSDFVQIHCPLMIQNTWKC